MSMLWTPDSLRATLKPFNWGLTQPSSGALWESYLNTYSLPSNDESYQHFAGHMQAAGFAITVQVWQPAKPSATAIIVHGLYDHVGLYQHLIRYCLARNWRVVAFDLPGHGLSNGKRASIANFQQYDQVFTRLLSNVAVHFDQPIHIFGQSTGAAIILNYLLKYGIKPAFSPFKSVNFIAPLVRPKEWRKIVCLYWLLKRFICSLKRGRSINSQDQKFLDFLWHNDPLQAGELGVDWIGAVKEWDAFIQQQESSKIAINIVQGNDDNSVLWQYNLAFLRKKFPNQQLRIIDTGRHHLVNEIEPLRNEMWQFFDEVITADTK